MRLFIKKICLYFVSYCILLAVVPAYILLTTPKLSDVDYDGGLIIKKERLKKLKDTDKIIFIGGSNLPFGIDSKTIEDSLHMKVINFGHRIQYRLGYYFREISDYIKEGDIVVIVPEYQIVLEDNLPENGMNTVFWEGLHEKPIPLNDLSRAVPNFYAYMADRYNLRHRNIMPQNSVNRKNGFNEYGDLTCHWHWERRPIKQYVEPAHMKVDALLDNELKKFMNICTAKKIRLVLIPPVYDNTSYVNTKIMVDSTIGFWKNYGMEYTRPPRDYVFADTFFFDSPYHLRYAGVSRKTSMIIEDLKKIIDDSSKIKRNTAR